MTKPTTDRTAPDRTERTPYRQETVEEAIARVRNSPTFIDILGPEKVRELQKEFAKEHEAFGPPMEKLLPVPRQKRRRR